jgi:hypothetical protein
MLPYHKESSMHLDVRRSIVREHKRQIAVWISHFVSPSYDASSVARVESTTPRTLLTQDQNIIQHKQRLGSSSAKAHIQMLKEHLLNRTIPHLIFQDHVTTVVGLPKVNVSFGFSASRLLHVVSLSG